MTAIVTATIEELRTIGIHYDGLQKDDLKTGSKVKIIKTFNPKNSPFGEIAEIEFLYEKLNYSIPMKWLKII